MNFNNKKSYKNQPSIVIYFSRAGENYAVGNILKGNTEVVAEYIRDITGAFLFKVEPMQPYSVDYETCVQEAEERIHNHNAPILQSIPDLSKYEVIYIGSPVYCGYMPEEMVTALKNIDFTGKIIRPFTTHEGSGLGSIPSQIKMICSGATVTDGLAIRGSLVYQSKDKVEDWI